jgi:hypothetical protein
MLHALIHNISYNSKLNNSAGQYLTNSMPNMQQPQDNDPVIITHLRKIHWITFINYWISFALLLSHGIVSGLPFPALGLVPMSISFLLACYRLIKLHKQDGQYQILLGDDQPKKGNEKEYVLALADLSIIISDLLVFIFTCLFTYPRYWRGFQALAAYGTVTLFVDM